MGKGKAKDKNNNKRYGVLKDNAITINIFLTRCIGLHNDELMQAKLTHKDLEKIFPNLKRTSYATILNDPSLVYTGKVVSVLDSNGELVPYMNEDNKKYLQSEEFEATMLESDWSNSHESWQDEKIDNTQSYELSEMSVYELEMLMRLYEKTGQIRDYEVVRKELVSRCDSKRASTISKQKAIKKSMKKNKNNDEY